MYRIIISIGLVAAHCSCTNPREASNIEELVDLEVKDSYFQTVEVHEKPKGSHTVESIVDLYEKRVLKSLSESLEKQDLKYEKLNLALVAFKDDWQLHLYGRNAKTENWRKFKSYTFTASSGGTGPKLKQGDYQIPEGVYNIELLNPNSKYHLSLRVNYPNEFDKKKAATDGRKNLGGDIMIHGRDVTVGCIPIGDVAIEELFILAAKSFKQGIPIIIAPQDFRKNKDYPYVLEIDWEKELYDQITLALDDFPE